MAPAVVPWVGLSRSIVEQSKYKDEEWVKGGKGKGSPGRNDIGRQGQGLSGSGWEVLSGCVGRP